MQNTFLHLQGEGLFGEGWVLLRFQVIYPIPHKGFTGSPWYVGCVEYGSER